MPREEYQRQLDSLNESVLEMGEMAVSQLELGLEALKTKDKVLARQVIADDNELNDRYLELEADCVDLFALQQPVAGDLRFIAASFKIITDLERVGDLATNLGSYTLRADRERFPDIDVYEIGIEAHDLLEDSLVAYDSQDIELCYAIAERDDTIDALCQRASDRVVRDLIEREANSEDPWSVEQLMDDVSRLLLTIRDLERVADHGVNIAARTLYMVESDPELIY